MIEINSLGYLNNSSLTQAQQINDDTDFGQILLDTMSQALSEQVLNTTTSTTGSDGEDALSGNSLDQLQPYVLAATANEDITAEQSAMMFMLTMMAQEFEGSEMSYMLDIFAATQDSLK